MKSTTAFIATGAEGTGTHMMRDFFVAAGCNWRQSDESPRPDIDMSGIKLPYVIHRSIPHAGTTPNFLQLISELRRVPSWPWAVFMVRDGHAAAESVKHRDPTREFSGEYFNSYYSQQRRALGVIGEIVGWTMGFDVVSYEAFCLQEGYRRWLTKRWELEYPESFEIKFANEKYYA